MNLLLIEAKLDELAAPDAYVVSPSLMVDGMALQRTGANPLVNTYEMIVRATTSGEFDLFTCSCGVAGCAGYQSEVEVIEQAETFTWVIPLEGYGRVLNPELLEGLAPGEPLRLVFEREAYLGQINKLDEFIRTAIAAHRFIAVDASERELELDQKPLKLSAYVKNLKRARKDHKALTARYRAFDACLGDLVTKTILLTVGEHEFSASVYSLGWYFPQEQDDMTAIELAFHWMPVRKQLLNDPLAFIESLSPEALESMFQSRLHPDVELLDVWGGVAPRGASLAD